MFLRLIKLLLKQNKHIESFRELLFSHKHFNLADTFKLFDDDCTGVLDAQKFADGFAQFNIGFDLDDLERLTVDIVDDDDD